ncbi:MAG: FecR domain-containing protein [Candidatus Symbiothrix sp.]|jgi:ferric-dicitrate binding protein FerR (iron transport regulator)|nr:FecR domain-containing protein [Candidatus Symbiothrix sp.]
MIKRKIPMQQLLERYFYGELNENEKTAFFSAVEKDAELKADFIRLQNIKGLTIVASSHTAGSEEAETSLRRFYAGIRMMRRQWRLQSFYRYAAIIVVAVLCTFVTVRYFVAGNDTLYSEIVVPVGQRVNITLTDGSKVCLNSRSRIRIPKSFNSRNRKVYLDGEACFEVVKAQGKPFTVETSRYNVRVLGTKFNVINYSEMPMFETTLIEGSVEVSNAGKGENIRLSPDEQVRLTDKGLQKIAIDAEDQTLWTNGVFAFDSQPFSEIIKRIELYYDVKFIIQNTKALDIVYTGKFKSSDSAEQIINAIHQTNKFNYRMSLDNKIIYIQ